MTVSLRAARDAMDEHDDRCGDCREAFRQHRPRCAEGLRLLRELQAMEPAGPIPSRPPGPVQGQEVLW